MNMALMIRNILQKPYYFNRILHPRYYSEASESNANEIPTLNTPGLGSSVYEMPKGAVGPGASKDSDYKNPEYFAYHNVSYFQAEIELAKYRCPQPSAIKKD